jgi:erythromycin esterase
MPDATELEARKRAEFLAWARTSTVRVPADGGVRKSQDLAPLGRMIGDATVVALSEAVHGGAEPLAFRNQVLEYLVQEKEFTAIAIESGIIEGRVVHDFIRGGEGNLEAALSRGISWNMDQLPQNSALVRWMRQYNADTSHQRKVSFYGFDIPGSPGVNATRGAATALNEACGYLTRVDPVVGEEFLLRLRPLSGYLQFDFHRPEGAGASSYQTLSEANRDALTAVIADIVSVLERQQGKYLAAGSADDYEWGYRAAIAARQVDAFLRQIPIGWQPPAGPATYPLEQADFISVAADVRDRAQADNLQWIVDHEGPRGKVLVYAHRYHLSTMPVRASWTGHGKQAVMGTYLRHRFGKRLISICNLIGQGEVRCGEYAASFGRASPDSMDGLAGELRTASFLLDFRTAPLPMGEWLAKEMPLGHGAHGSEHEILETAVGRAFDLVVYFDTIHPACPPS